MNDFINREDAIDELCENCFMQNCSHDCDVIKSLRRVTAADVRPVVRGGWKPNPRNPYWLDCTVCGYGKSEKMVYNYCPNCGADMRTEGDGKDG